MKMKYIQGKDRNQLCIFPISMDAAIDPDHEVRLIDLFVESLDCAKLGFKVDFGENGRPAYHPKDLLKIFIYGYLNRIRSSRELEKETKRNIELMWLLKGLSPDHNTISNFRKDNSKAIKRVFRTTVEIAKNFELIGGKLLAGDSTKLRAQNSKKNNFNEKKIDRHLNYIEEKLAEYQEQLSQNDGDNLKLMEEEIAKHEERKQKYHQLQKELEESGETQISTSDPESRQMITRNNITEVAYNVQTTVDAKHNIPIDYKVTNENDSKAMGNMVRRAKSILHTQDFTALYDKGYHTGSEFAIADRLGVDVMVAIPAVSSHAPDTNFDVEHFQYNPHTDTYQCPANESLKSNGSWYNKSRGKSIVRVKQYISSACKTCELRSKCTKNKGGRMIERSEHAEFIAANKEKLTQNEHKYRRRQAIVEHPYGTIKRQWGFSYIMTKKTIQRATADVGLMFTAYNLRRLINITGYQAFTKYLVLLLAFFMSILSPNKESTAIFWTKVVYAIKYKFYKSIPKIVILYPQYDNKMVWRGGF